MAEVKEYILKTCLIEDSTQEFYYQGTAEDPVISFAMNTIVALDAKHAKVFANHSEIVCLCNALNTDVQLAEHGFAQFEIVIKELL